MKDKAMKIAMEKSFDYSKCCWRKQQSTRKTKLFARVCSYRAQLQTIEWTNEQASETKKKEIIEWSKYTKMRIIKSLLTIFRKLICSFVEFLLVSVFHLRVCGFVCPNEQVSAWISFMVMRLTHRANVYARKHTSEMIGGKYFGDESVCIVVFCVQNMKQN